ncbi:uncharacterized protein LOC131679589 [Topomyia yanbarensis]|uniref:uncharacterized protein LOC131679589 n=1 Tax=Topomyia yanbarensis TaxID=2498891 RepID=UPI00273BC3D9|nr:uncharacterized protein LOC131679589 [Topomyia yanbarensis]
MAKPIFYTLHLSPPCRAVQLTAKALGVELDHQVVNLLTGDHLKPDFLKINPQHTIPVLDDNGVIVPESHAIVIYLVSKYGEDDSLYPKDLAQQAKVNAALHFESGVLFARTRFLFEAIFTGCGEIHPEKAEYIKKAYQLLEDTLVDDYVAGTTLTIADLSCISTIASVMGVVPMERSQYPKIYAWIDRLKELPYYEEANGASAAEHSQLILNIMKRNAANPCSRTNDQFVSSSGQVNNSSNYAAKKAKMGKVVLYTAKLSPPGRSVELTAKALGLELEIKPINLIAGDHLKPEFVKMNPQHTIPLIIDDDGTTVYDSHAIIIYLTTKYGKDDSLYPSDIVTRAKINSALHFDSGVLFARLRFYLEPILYYGSAETPQDKIDYLYKAYGLLNDTLVDDYIVGNKLTLADLSCVASIASFHAIFPIDKSKYPKLAAWVERLSKLPYYKKTNQEGAEELAALYRVKLEENRQKA